jgi:16S rRNA A1518/A1519 N6-dimethyltransferase RsmA/KsgA/DIM1 with predicted DNA glycosylase/AP lyase activity
VLVLDVTGKGRSAMTIAALEVGTTIFLIEHDGRAVPILNDRLHPTATTTFPLA